MRYQRTQIYLEPEHHRRLVEEARERGISLAALLREIVAERVSERAPKYGEKSWDALIGIIDTGEETDIVGRWDEYMADVWEARYRKKMGLPVPPPKPLPPRKRSGKSPRRRK